MVSSGVVLQADVASRGLRGLQSDGDCPNCGCFIGQQLTHLESICSDSLQLMGHEISESPYHQTNTTAEFQSFIEKMLYRKTIRAFMPILGGLDIPILVCIVSHSGVFQE